MTKAQERMIKSICSRNFQKYISIVNKDNGNAFVSEVPLILFPFFLCLNFAILNIHVIFTTSSTFIQNDQYFFKNLVLDMSIEKL